MALLVFLLREQQVFPPRERRISREQSTWTFDNWKFCGPSRK